LEKNKIYVVVFIVVKERERERKRRRKIFYVTFNFDILI